MTVLSNPTGHTAAIQNRLCNHNGLERLKIFFHESQWSHFVVLNLGVQFRPSQATGKKDSRKWQTMFWEIILKKKAVTNWYDLLVQFGYVSQWYVLVDLMGLYIWMCSCLLLRSRSQLSDWKMVWSLTTLRMGSSPMWDQACLWRT